jgi:hypothetical protein
MRSRLVSSNGVHNPELRVTSPQEEAFEIETRPADRTCGGGNSNRFTLDSPAEPVEKLLFLALHNHWLTSDAERGHDRPMHFEFAREPVRPLRHSRDPEDMGDRRPDESVFRTCQQGSS